MTDISRILMNKYNNIYMSDIYCVKCKTKTPTVDEKIVTTKNNRNAITGQCQNCGRTKYMFIKKTI